MRVSIYRVAYYVVVEVGGVEVRRNTDVKSVLVAAKDHIEAAKLLPVSKTVNLPGEVNRNVVITCQAVHQNVICAEWLTLDEELSKVEAT